MQCHYCENTIDSEGGIRLGESDLFFCHSCYTTYQIKQMKKAKENITEEKSARDRVDNYIKHKNGAIFLLTENTKSKDLVFLVSKKNKMNSFSLKNIRQGLVDGEWLEVNEHEVAKWDSVYSDHILNVTQKVLKHVMIAELLIEVDEDLDTEEIGDSYFRNLLAKSNKQAMRIAEKHFNNLYKVDPVMLQNMMRVMEELVSNVAKLPLEDYPFFAKFTEKYFEDAKSFRSQEVQFIKPEK
jgi:hypothetical protein